MLFRILALIKISRKSSDSCPGSEYMVSYFTIPRTQPSDFCPLLQVSRILSLLHAMNEGVLVDIIVVDDARAWLCWDISCKAGGSLHQITILYLARCLTCTTHVDSSSHKSCMQNPLAIVSKNTS
ncbi:hypothetical protein BofuT4_P041200.1 [Botrytis cinerea T4]|uniref:Uncharacterized protein n=1 Tax=Botryotinia fuckeliana (strain T4) TaxID=999810 RepID=G2Y1G9_BOTF4|nr:hypothetical protein BofuT4_P041200.1 [Botrytis cinerea T4]